MIVVDASVGFKWLIPEQDSDKAERLLTEDLHAPDFFQVEVANALTVSAIKGRVVDIQGLLTDLMLKLPALHDSGMLLQRAVEIAGANRRSIYDSIYVALAEREQCELVTADKRLYNALQTKFPFILDLSTLP